MAANNKVDPRRQAAVLAAQFNKAVQQPNEYVKFFMDTDKPSEWWILIHNFAGDNDEFVGGEYLVKMIAPPNFPYAPPEFYFYTENGVYEIKSKVCINIGEYHADQYRAALGMSGFANQLWNGMIGWKSLGGGISIIKTTPAQKRHLAEISRESNINNYSEILARIESCYSQYSKKWPTTKPSEKV